MARTLRDYPSVALKPEDLDGKIDFVRIFGRPGPVHIEIGCGKAAFLLNEAAAQPQANFLGIERANRYYRYAVDRIGRWALTNVRIIRTDAAHFLADFVPPGSVDCLHIYFPDPWPKRRHNKRRLFVAANLDRLIRALKTGGTIKVATDHAEYFESITMLFKNNSGKVEPTEFLPATGAAEGERVGTNFERKYLKQNRPIYTIAVRKM
jgi:tRNA (guanine-N7-)-methyltransferase